MAVNLSTIQSIENHEQWSQLYKILAEAHPTNQSIQTELGKLANNRETHLSQLKTAWDSRPVPLYSQDDIKRLCTAFYARDPTEGVLDEMQERVIGHMNSRDWIIRDTAQWRGFDAENGTYHDNPIRFDGDLPFTKVYEPLVVWDKESGSCNLIWSIRKLIKEGGENALSSRNWIALWLHFSQKFMNSTYHNLSRYSDDLESLFTTLISNINVDEEVAKLRAAMSKLHRDPKMPLQCPLYKLKSSYELLLGINFPLMDQKEILTKSDSYSVNCAKYFISRNTNLALESYIQLKLTKGEKLNVILVCQLVQRHESTVTSDQIQATMFLPEHCCRLDTSLVTATNTEQLFIQAAEFQRGRNRSFSGNGQSSSQRGNRQSSSRRGSQQRNGSRRRFFRSPGGRFRPKSARRQSQSPGRNSYQKSSSGQSGRRNSHQRVTSKHGRRYSRSPGGKSWFISSRSSTPKNNYNQDNRGRAGNPATQPNCMRCGGSHISSDCRLYTFWSGDPCGKCGKMHATQAHRNRSTSATRATASRISGYESILVPTAPSLNPVNFLEREVSKN